MTERKVATVFVFLGIVSAIHLLTPLDRARMFAWLSGAAARIARGFGEVAIASELKAHDIVRGVAS